MRSSVDSLSRESVDSLAEDLSNIDEIIMKDGPGQDTGRSKKRKNLREIKMQKWLIKHRVSSSERKADFTQKNLVFKN